MHVFHNKKFVDIFGFTLQNRAKAIREDAEIHQHEGDKIMKKFVALLLALVMVLSLAACGAQETPAATKAPETPAASEAPAATEAPAAPAADPITLRFAFSEAETSQTAQIMKAVAANILERTEGRVVVDCYYSNALGSINDSIEQITLGGNIVTSTSASSWAPYGCEDMTAMDCMFAFSSTDEIAAFNESEMWANMVAELEEKGGIHMICMNWAAAPRVILANKPINSVADLKGCLVRVPTNTYAAWFSALGASPVSGIPFSEVYQNIESGVISGAEAPFATLSDYSVQEVAKYAYCSNHTYAAACFGTSTAVWSLLSPEDQAVVTEELTKGGAEFTAQCAASNTDYIAKMQEAGVTVVEPTAEDVATMQAAAAQAAKDLGCRDGVMEEIKAASQG